MPVEMTGAEEWLCMYGGCRHEDPDDAKECERYCQCERCKHKLDVDGRHLCHYRYWYEYRDEDGHVIRKGEPAQECGCREVG